jgi:hypothetical protein
LPADPARFVPYVVCLNCERFFFGLILLRGERCQLCGQAALRAIASWDTNYSAWFPFHPEGGDV